MIYEYKNSADESCFLNLQYITRVTFLSDPPMASVYFVHDSTAPHVQLSVEAGKDLVAAWKRAIDRA